MNIRIRSRRVWPLLALGGLLACSDSVGVKEVTDVSFSVAPEEVRPGTSFGATLTIRNVSNWPLKLVSGMGCISFLAVDGAPLGDPVKGTDFGCLAVVTKFRFQPGETRSWNWELAAETSSGQPLAPGDYHLEAGLNVSGLEHPRATFSVTVEG